jgi:hypothetical protein
MAILKAQKIEREKPVIGTYIIPKTPVFNTSKKDTGCPNSVVF